MAPSAKEQRERLALVGKSLRAGVGVPTDTFITDDIPLLLTRLSRVAGIPPADRPHRAGKAP